jgi:hypothetical protein
MTALLPDLVGFAIKLIYDACQRLLHKRPIAMLLIGAVVLAIVVAAGAMRTDVPFGSPSVERNRSRSAARGTGGSEETAVPRAGPASEQADRIELPEPHVLVPPMFPARGTIALAPGEVGWLVVRKGNVVWPKEPAIRTSGRWSLTVYEGGPAGQFELVLLAVAPEIDRMFESWFDQVRTTGQTHGIPLNAQMRVLAETPLTLAD